MSGKKRWLFCFVAGVLLSDTARAGSDSPRDFRSFLASCPVVDEIDAAVDAPVHEYPKGCSEIRTILGRASRVLPAGDDPKVMAWVIGKGRGLRAGQAYLLEVEYPDDVPRSIFLANRGADLVRGFATGSALGDSRQQYVQPSVESLRYPQTGQWQTYGTIFLLNDRFQGLYAQRDPEPGGRPFVPADGFHVLVFQTKQSNDPPSAGSAVARLRLRELPDLLQLYPRIEFPSDDLPRRRVFYREEMADEAVSAKEANDRGVADPVAWLVGKARMARFLGYNTFAKDLLEFGFNQGWESGDQDWVMNAQPPLTDLWDRGAPLVSAEGLDLLPYYEYKGGIGLPGAKPQSLAWQRRSQKLYHTDQDIRYTPVWWTEDHNADLTDPDTIEDAKRLLDRTIISHKGKARFAGAWFRTRDNHLPISFAEPALARFRAQHQNDPALASISREKIIASYEGDGALYNRYLDWWLQQRALFLDSLHKHLSAGLGQESVQILFTPWTSEQIPMLRDPASGVSGHPVQVTTDDVPWWKAFAERQPSDSWFRWALMPTLFQSVVDENMYASSLAFRDRIPSQGYRAEGFHSAPPADPEHYRGSRSLMLTYPFGRLFTVARSDLMEQYRSGCGLTVIHHFALNEDNHDRTKGPSNLPFDGQVGYICVDADRAGPHVRLAEARALAFGDPRNMGALCASGYSTGFPEYVRRFNQAFLAVPALPSRGLEEVSSDPEVVVREVPAGGHGTYYYVVNTSMAEKLNVKVRLSAGGPVRDLVDHEELPGPSLILDLYPGEVRSYRVGPT